MMSVILFGPHGAGKGIQAELIAKHYSIPHVSTGDIFKGIAKDPSKVSYLPKELGEAIRDTLARNEYVSDDITNRVVEYRLSHGDCKDGFVLDGYPRTTQQAKALDSLMSKLGKKGYIVVNFANLSDDLLVKRLLHRVICPKCGASYNTLLNPPKKSGVCDACGSALTKRSDDTDEGIRSRNREYETKAKPLLGYYRRKGVVVDVDASRKPEEVFKDIRVILDNRGTEA